MFISKTFLLAALAALKYTVHAAPTSDVDNLVVIDTQDSPFGPLVIYGFANATVTESEDTSAATLNERACGSNDVTCDGGNVPNAQACSNLIAALSANGGTSLGVSPRSICQTTNGNTCCVSWHNPAPGLVESMLIAGANAAYNGCVVHASVKFEMLRSGPPMLRQVPALSGSVHAPEPTEPQSAGTLRRSPAQFAQTSEPAC